MRKLIAIVSFLLLLVLEAQAGYFMPAYWMYSHSEPILLKDIDNNILAGINHDSNETNYLGCNSCNYNC